MQTAYYASRVLTYIPETAIIIEIGGGFGALASRIMRARPKAVYLSSDLPINMILTEAYLRSMFGDACKPAYNVHDDLPEGARSVIMPPWKFFRLKGRATIVNTMSFQHGRPQPRLLWRGDEPCRGPAALFRQPPGRHLKGASATIPARNYSFRISSGSWRTIRSMNAGRDSARRNSELRSGAMAGAGYQQEHCSTRAGRTAKTVLARWYGRHGIRPHPNQRQRRGFSGRRRPHGSPFPRW